VARVQLALNVSDLDAAVDFYSRLFATEPAKRYAGYANFAIADPPLKLVLIESPAARGNGGGSDDSRRGASDQRSPLRCRHDDRRAGVDHLLLRRPGQGLGQRSGRRTLGVLHGPGRCAR
jgi:catechol 2,3-dioxygenase-like lactoylglutathione lyase family enzyme